MSQQNALSLTAAASESTMIRVAAITGDGVILVYSSLPGNDPSAYGNFVAVWEDSIIPYSKPPLQKIPISGNTPKGSLAVQNLMPDKNEYIFGYAVGPRVGDICAYAYIAPDKPEIAFSSTLTLTLITPDSIVLSYSLPPGCDPVQNSASVALWRGSIGSYTKPPLANAAITDDASTGNVALTNLQIIYGMTYTAAILMSHNPTSMAAWVTFQVG